MSSKQTQKGARLEYAVRDLLSNKTGVKWERTPLSGGGAIKGDLFVPTGSYFYCIECKNFKDTVIKENLLSAKSNLINSWWEQACREAEYMRKTPALVFKMDRGKMLIAVTEDLPKLNCLSIRTDLGEILMDINVYLFEDWLAWKLPEELAI